MSILSKHIHQRSLGGNNKSVLDTFPSLEALSVELHESTEALQKVNTFIESMESGVIGKDSKSVNELLSSVEQQLIVNLSNESSAQANTTMPEDIENETDPKTKWQMMADWLKKFANWLWERIKSIGSAIVNFWNRNVPKIKRESLMMKVNFKKKYEKLKERLNDRNQPTDFGNVHITQEMAIYLSTYPQHVNIRHSLIVGIPLDESIFRQIPYGMNGIKNEITRLLNRVGNRSESGVRYVFDEISILPNLVLKGKRVGPNGIGFVNGLTTANINNFGGYKDPLISKVRVGQVRMFFDAANQFFDNSDKLVFDDIAKYVKLIDTLLNVDSSEREVRKVYKGIYKGDYTSAEIKELTKNLSDGLDVTLASAKLASDLLRYATSVIMGLMATLINLAEIYTLRSLEQTQANQ